MLNFLHLTFVAQIINLIFRLSVGSDALISRAQQVGRTDWSDQRVA